MAGVVSWGGGAGSAAGVRAAAGAAAAVASRRTHASRSSLSRRRSSARGLAGRPIGGASRRQAPESVASRPRAVSLDDPSMRRPPALIPPRVRARARAVAGCDEAQLPTSAARRSRSSAARGVCASRSELGKAAVSATLSFDVSRHPDGVQGRQGHAEPIGRRRGALCGRGQLVYRAQLRFLLDETRSSPPRPTEDGDGDGQGVVARSSAARGAARRDARTSARRCAARRARQPRRSTSTASAAERAAAALLAAAGGDAGGGGHRLPALPPDQLDRHGRPRATNPFISEAGRPLLDELVRPCCTRRVGQINRCVSEATGLLKLLSGGGGGGGEGARREAASAITLKAQSRRADAHASPLRLWRRLVRPALFDL